jgi:hypothetical protein
MKETATHQSTYALGHSGQELERLSRQAQVFEPLRANCYSKRGSTRACASLTWEAAVGTSLFWPPT